MIEVNIWLSTTRIMGKRIKHGIFGPLLASSSSENTGHANFEIHLSENSSLYPKVELNPYALVEAKTISELPAVESSNGSYSSQGMKGIVFSHSFWPQQVPSRTDLMKDSFSLTHLCKPSKGVAPEMSTHLQDMQREGRPKEVIIHNPLNLVSINALQREHSQLRFEFTKLEAALENKKNQTKKLGKLSVQKAELEQTLQQLFVEYHGGKQAIEKKIEKLQSQQDIFVKKLMHLRRKTQLFSHYSYPDESTQRDMLQNVHATEAMEKEVNRIVADIQSLKEQIAQLDLQYTQQSDSYQKEHARMNNEISLCETLINNYDTTIKGRDEKDLKDLEEQSDEKLDLAKRTEYLLHSRNKTEGKPPEYSIQLPTTPSANSDKYFYIDEQKVLAAMQQETSQNYSFILNNCSTSVKRCLLAGITPELKTHLQKEAGIPASFFKVRNIETCVSLRNWVIQLEKGLNVLNFPPKAPMPSADTPVMK